MEQYKFKDILINFRKEYIEIRKKIDELEKEIKIIDNSLAKCLLFLNDDTNALTYYLIDKEKYVISALIHIKKKLGLPTFDLENISLDQNIRSIYHFRNDLKHYHVMVEDIKSFTNKLLLILNDEFISNMKKDTIESINNNYSLYYGYNSLSQEKNDDLTELSGIAYYPYKDLIKIEHLKPLTTELLNRELNTLYNANNFNDKQRDIIERSTIDIEVLNNGTHKQFFNIIEEDKKLILK